MGARRIRRIHYIDPYLGPLAGHWATLARSFIRGARAFDIEVRLAGNRRQERAFLEELEVAPAFSLAPYTPYGPNPHDRPCALAAFEQQVAMYAAELEAALRPASGDEDLLLFPTIYPPILGGILRWANADAARRSQRAAFLMHFSDDVDVYNRARRAGGNYYFVDYYRRVFPPATGRRTYPHWRYFSLSPGLSDLFAIILGEDFAALPMAMAGLAGVAPPRPRRDPGVAVTVAIVGHTSIQRGGLLLKEIVSSALDRHPHARFSLQISTNPDTERLREEFPETTARVAVRYGYIPEVELQAIVDAADIVVLPYAPAPYRLMASASFVQAAASGKAVVVPGGTHMHRELLAHGGGYAVFGEHSAAAIGAALSSAIERVDALTAAAEAAAPGYRSRCSSRACVEQLLNAFGDSRTPFRAARSPALAAAAP